MTPEAIKNFTEQNVMNFFNNFYDNSSSQGNSFNQGMYATFNPLDKIIELYERLIKDERDKFPL